MSKGIIQRFISRYITGEKLPERISETIRCEQSQSERLIGWIQLAVVMVFAILYFLAPRPNNPDLEFSPVPWVLASYLSFTLIRLYLSYKTDLPGWFIILSVVADIALLMGTIWFFHLQYMQPPSFYLKSPTLLYVFIFIALRTLRFEARYIFLSGIFAAAGWMILVIYVVTADPSDPMITRDYVEYITSNSVLLGAEFDKIISILLVTLILGFSVSRARALLVSSVRETQAAKSLSKFFSGPVAEKIAKSDQEIGLGHGIARDCTIMFLDIRGFTPLAASLTPSEQITLLTDYQAQVVPVIHDCNGIVDKYLGDGILASFGAVKENSSCAADALRAVEHLFERVDSWNQQRQDQGLSPIEINAAVTYGSIVFGVIGDDNHLEYTVLGDAVNQAAKLEKHVKSEESRAVISEVCLKIALKNGYKGSDRWIAREKRAVSGVETPMNLYIYRD
ncbi:MAG: adenylate/guanylate cyclase domain-containing protein [Alphaproteobacteria bacterium]|nr:adenylate/guanylate cyclase domain-containing protein [Rhodospirillales bacterium]MCW9044787.1 adenylate/guanylate cyclase domain-containing protein [Alphaproteobacteria bacterium]